MNKIFVPTKGSKDWKSLLAKPDKHWKTGYSAKALAYCWEEANGFPECVKRVFRNSGIDLFQNIELLLAFPEYKVPLQGGRRASQNDVFVLARGNDQLVSIMVEGKVSESFDKTIAEWREDASGGKPTRLKFLCGELQLQQDQVDFVRYQLLHRTASAIIEAKRFNAENALMLVHSFSQCDEWFDDYKKFAALFGLDEITPDSLAYAKNIDGIDLYLAWVRGDMRYLEK